MYSIGLTVLLLGVMVTTYGVWTQSSFSHADPSFDQGCYCHNNGIAVWVNDSGDGNGGLYLGSFTAGSSFHLLVSTNDAQATGVVPGLQLWESNQTDNAKFTISPTEVATTSSANLNKTAGSITALYKITAPSTPGTYTLTLYGQGTLLQPLALQVTGGTTSSTTSTTTTTTTPTTTSTTTTTTSHTTTTTTTPTTTSTTTTTQSSSTSTTSTTTKSSASSSTTSTSTSPSSTSTTSASTSTTPTVGITFTSPSLGESLVGNETYTISGTIYPTPALPDSVYITVQLLLSSTVLDSSTQAVTASGTFSYTTHVGGSQPWTLGPYLITATDSSGLKGTTTFEYGTSATTSTTATTTTTATTSTAATETITQTATQTLTATTATTLIQTVTSTTTASAPKPATSTTTQTVAGPTTTVTGAASTVTSTATTTVPPTTLTHTQTTTQTATSTVTQKTSSIPGWAYGVMAVLLILGLAIGYVVKNLVPNRPAVKGAP